MLFKNIEWLTTILDNITKKYEYSQALTRVVLSGILTIYYAVGDFLHFEKLHHHDNLLFICFGYFIFAIGWMVWVKLSSNGHLIRKYLSMFFDLLIISVALAINGPHHLGVFLLYYWVILGYGYRYGSKWVIYSSGISFVLLAGTLIFAPSWEYLNPHTIEILFVFSVVMWFNYRIINNLENEITKRSIYQRRAYKFEHKSKRDGLTHLCNREFAFDWLETKKEHNIQVGVLFLDLDNFKTFNDTYGHHVGDNVLINISKRLVNSVRTQDVVCRYAGDEFIVLINDDDVDIINEIADRITDALNQTVEIDSGERLTVTASIGAAILGVHGKTAETVLQNADSAMYIAKRKGRNRVAWFEGKLKDETI